MEPKFNIGDLIINNDDPDKNKVIIKINYFQPDRQIVYDVKGLGNENRTYFAEKTLEEIESRWKKYLIECSYSSNYYTVSSSPYNYTYSITANHQSIFAPTLTKTIAIDTSEKYNNHYLIPDNYYLIPVKPQFRIIRVRK